MVATMDPCGDASPLGFKLKLGIPFRNIEPDEDTLEPGVELDKDSLSDSLWVSS